MTAPLRLEDFCYRKPTNRVQIAAWVEGFLGFKLHSTVRCTDNDHAAGKPHSSQLDYVSEAFLGTYSSAVVMAARNAGKSYAAAILDLLEAWHKPGIKIAVVGFIRQQSDYIYTYLQDFLATFARTMGWGKDSGRWTIRKNDITFKNGSIIRFFSGGKSQANIKGFHPDILQVDEGDQFSFEQFDGLANALEASGTYARRFDLLSTNYKVSGDGVVLRQIAKYEQWNKNLPIGMKPCRVFRICLIDILEHCPPTFQCINDAGQHCPIWQYCRGRAKQGSGHYKIASALETMRDSSLPTFESQMLLLRPSSEFSYFHNFSTKDNVKDEIPFVADAETYIGIDFGGSRCPHAGLLVQRVGGKDGVYNVLDEFQAMGNIEYLLQKITAKYKDARDYPLFIDPKGNGKADNYVGARSYADILRKDGWFPRNKQFTRRETFQMLSRLIQPATGPTRFQVTKRCPTLIKQIQAAEHTIVRGHMTEEPADLPDDDLLDSLRFILGFTFGKTVPAGYIRSMFF